MRSNNASLCLIRRYRVWAAWIGFLLLMWFPFSNVLLGDLLLWLFGIVKDGDLFLGILGVCPE